MIVSNLRSGFGVIKICTWFGMITHACRVYQVRWSLNRTSWTALAARGSRRRHSPRPSSQYDSIRRESSDFLSESGRREHSSFHDSQRLPGTESAVRQVTNCVVSPASMWGRYPREYQPLGSLMFKFYDRHWVVAKRVVRRDCRLPKPDHGSAILTRAMGPRSPPNPTSLLIIPELPPRLRRFFPATFRRRWRSQGGLLLRRRRSWQPRGRGYRRGRRARRRRGPLSR